MSCLCAAEHLQRGVLVCLPYHCHATGAPAHLTCTNIAEPWQISNFYRSPLPASLNIGSVDFAKEKLGLATRPLDARDAYVTSESRDQGEPISSLYGGDERCELCECNPCQCDKVDASRVPYEVSLGTGHGLVPSHAALGVLSVVVLLATHPPVDSVPLMQAVGWRCPSAA